jgi:hypothetical protein
MKPVALTSSGAHFRFALLLQRRRELLHHSRPLLNLFHYLLGETKLGVPHEE